jgi:hypothetical protein
MNPQSIKHVYQQIKTLRVVFGLLPFVKQDIAWSFLSFLCVATWQLSQNVKQTFIIL